MDYFVTNNLYNEKNSDIEIFKKIQEKKPVGLITLDFYRYNSVAIKKLNIESSKYVNMFEQIQQVQKTKVKIVRLKDIKFQTDLEKPIEFKPNEYAYYRQGYRVGEVVVFDGSDRVAQVKYFDKVGHMLQIDSYDEHGFKSIETAFGSHGGVATDRMFTPDGKLAFEEFYRYIDENNVASTLSILYNDSVSKMYDSRRQLVIDFLQTIKKDTGNLLASEKLIQSYELPSSIVKNVG